MGFVVKLVDATLFLFFLIIAAAAPLLDAQTLVPHTYFPHFLLRLKAWYTAHYGDYLVAEKPHFFVGLVWFELLFQWPLVLFNLYGVLTAKPWFPTTCLIYGVSVSTSMAAILSEMLGSKRASDRLLMMYFPFMGLGVLATLRGLLSHSTTTFSNVAKRPAFPRKKRA
ncbi:transmembrane protein 97-like [Senna tora]|uniref:Transmembrane protein 97-like n=1 Tax=Senna tora TaxID=362788 RepID=A0A834W1M5_9FABA|nr:transmembrane protein 97-like [Senna tora]